MASTLLALETATDVCSAALMRDGTLTAQASLHRPRVHAEQLAPLIRDLLARAAVDRSALDAVAVSMGPGSYTGLRIGVSTAKGLALAVDAVLIGVPTLEALAASVQPCAELGDVACALLDARRDEVYAAAYRFDDDGLAPFAATSARAVDTLPDWLGAVERAALDRGRRRRKIHRPASQRWLRTAPAPAGCASPRGGLGGPPGVAPAYPRRDGRRGRLRALLPESLRRVAP